MVLGFDPLSWAIGYSLKKGADFALDKITSGLSKKLMREVTEWINALPSDLYVDPVALFPPIQNNKDLNNRPALTILRQTLCETRIPEREHWHHALLEQWAFKRQFLGDEGAGFFQLEEAVASKHIGDLAGRLYKVVATDESAFMLLVLENLETILESLETMKTSQTHIFNVLNEILIKAPPISSSNVTNNYASIPSSQAFRGVDFVILTTLRIELEAMLLEFPSAKILSIGNQPDRIFYECAVETNNGKFYRIILATLLRSGNIESSLLGAEVLTLFKPANMVVAGIAGALTSDGVQLGDVVIAEDILPYQISSFSTGQPSFHSRKIHSSVKLVEHAKIFAVNTGAPNVCFGDIASGELLIDDFRFAKALRELSPRVIAVEMESAGVATAAVSSVHEIDFITIRAIADFAGAGKSVSSQKVAAKNIAKWLRSFLASEPMPAHDKLDSVIKYSAVSSHGNVGPLDPVWLYKEIMRRIDTESFKTLCFLLGVELGPATSSSMPDRVREVIQLFDQQGKLSNVKSAWDEYLRDSNV